MGSGICENCLATSSEIMSTTDNMVCPYCRSSPIFSQVQDDSQEFIMCSPLSSSESLGSSLTRNVQNVCVQRLHSSHKNIHSHFERVVETYTCSNSYTSSSQCGCAKNPTSNSKFSSSNSNSRANFCSLSNHGWRALHVFLLAIIFVLPGSTMSSPVHHASRSSSPHPSNHRGHHSSPHRPMKWINPCRIPSSSQPPEISTQFQSDEEIYQNIVTQAKKAEVQAKNFFDDFKEECFGKGGHDFEDVHYDWLTDIADTVNKNLGDSLPPERLSELKEDEVLKSMYRGLQKLAVGLEQVVLDQGIHGGNFYKHFNEAEFQLKYVLCEFQIAMMEKNIKYEDVTREIMGKDFVELEDKTWRNFRDFTIFRDYVNTLEFIRESFEHFWKLAKRTPS